MQNVARTRMFAVLLLCVPTLFSGTTRAEEVPLKQYLDCDGNVTMIQPETDCKAEPTKSSRPDLRLPHIDPKSNKGKAPWVRPNPKTDCALAADGREVGCMPEPGKPRAEPKPEHKPEIVCFRAPCTDMQTELMNKLRRTKPANVERARVHTPGGQRMVPKRPGLERMPKNRGAADGVSNDKPRVDSPRASMMRMLQQRLMAKN